MCFACAPQAGTGKKPRAVIMVCLAGGPSHIDMYDLKPERPVDYRGEFNPIKTNVPGFDICEHMPLQAQIADKLALVRTVQFVEPMQHELQEMYSGFTKAAKRPSFGSVISRFRPGGPRAAVLRHPRLRRGGVRKLAVSRCRPSARCRLPATRAAAFAT